MNRFVSTSLALALVALSLVFTPVSAQTFITDLGRAVSNLFAPRVVGSGNVVQETRGLSHKV